MWIIADHMPDIANNPLLKFLRRHMRVTGGLRGNAFWVRETDPPLAGLNASRPHCSWPWCWWSSSI